MFSKYDDEWESKVVKDVLLEHLKESRRARRWNMFFRLTMIFIVGFLIYISFKSTQIVETGRMAKVSKSHIAKIDIKGIISNKSQTNADDIYHSLQKISKSPNAKAVVLVLNTPGGTSVQARRIYNSIMRFKKENSSIKIYAIIDEIATSAGYLVACAADEIYADETSFVGSVGALVNSFGFVDTMEKFGIERRLYVAGKHKGMLDPFSPENEDHKKFIQKSLDLVHDEFIENVRTGRKDRLQSHPDIFSGRFWTGKEAIELGLIDGFGDIYSLSKDVIKIENIIDYTKQYSLIEKFSKGFTAKMLNFKSALMSFMNYFCMT